MKNFSASVHARLQQLFREEKKAFSEVCEHFCHEQLLYRLSQLKYRNRFLLKGAFLLYVLKQGDSRHTRDIDFLAYLPNDIPTMEKVFREVCQVEYAEETYQRCRDVAAALSGPPHFMTISHLVEEALLAHLQLMEKKYNKGKPFPKFEGKVKTGRPIGS